MPDRATAPPSSPPPGSSGPARTGRPAREEILTRIRTALGSGPTPGGLTAGLAATDTPGPPARPDLPPYRTHAGPGTDDLTGLLAGRLSDYGCAVHHVTSGELATTIAAALARRGARRIIIPPGLGLPGLPDLATLPGLPPGTEITADDGRPPRALDSFDAVITTAAVAIAETGTIILDGSPGQGRRALTLIPDYHLCILRTDQIVALPPGALARLDPSRPHTWISGPSATSDIELQRVQGVHGPRTLEVILTGPAER